jgi:hypothetical protein
MSQNIITSIPADALVGLTNFRILIMADNLLSTLPATAAVSTTLQELYVAPSSDAAVITLFVGIRIPSRRFLLPLSLRRLDSQAQTNATPGMLTLTPFSFWQEFDQESDHLDPIGEIRQLKQHPKGRLFVKSDHFPCGERMYLSMLVSSHFHLAR